jgi:hypothetical protein
LTEASDGSAPVQRNEIYNAHHAAGTIAKATAGPNSYYDTGIQCANGKRLIVPHHAALASGGNSEWSFTIAVWVRLLDLTNQYIICKGLPGNTEYRIEYDAATTLFRFWASYNGTANTARNFSAITPVINTWYLLGAEHDGPGNRLGARINNNAPNYSGYNGAGIFNGNNDLYIGGRADPVYSTCVIAQPMFYPRLLTQAEWDWLWNNGSGRRYLTGQGWV